HPPSHRDPPLSRCRRPRDDHPHHRLGRGRHLPAERPHPATRGSGQGCRRRLVSRQGRRPKPHAPRPALPARRWLIELYLPVQATLSGGVFSHRIDSVIPEARLLLALVIALSRSAFSVPVARGRQIVCPTHVMIVLLLVR